MNNKAEFGIRIMQEEMVDQNIAATRANPRSGTLGNDRVDSAVSYALFGENRFDVTDKLSITPGLRIEHYEQEHKDRKNSARNGKSSNTEYLPGIGATYWVSPGAQLYGSVYKAFSPPLEQPVDRDRRRSAVECGALLNIEMGVRGQTGKLRYELTAFQMDFDNQITPGHFRRVGERQCGQHLASRPGSCIGIRLEQRLQPGCEPDLDSDRGLP
ncbi:MAG: TonB-dependent receptor [Rhodocyclaceae bacterium]|nr:TonB-dependent receptor [Rhodocyclaceae bacterium]